MSKYERPNKTDAMRWLDEQSVAGMPKCFKPLLKGYKGVKVGMQLRAYHLAAFT